MGREVVLAVFDGVQLLDVAGVTDVFDGAGYGVRLASVGGRDVTASARVRLGAHLDLADLHEVDTLIVAGGFGYEQAVADPVLLGHLRRIRARRIASVCTGAFVLAAAGLLRSRATTHWSMCAELQKLYPDLEVVPDAVFVRDGNVTTSAGVSAGVDLSLALVEDDCGTELARTVAKWLVVFMQRPGGQSQFSVPARLPPVRHDGLRRLLDALAADPAADWSLAAMAERASLSTRHFSRIFPRETGVSPGRHVERLRVEVARSLLETGGDGVDSIARRCGFGSAETMRRAFLRELGVPPSDYRDRFQRREYPWTSPSSSTTA
ncbi:MAG: helix-turn-helix domain-containing protein [Streptosporangiaceae bacterium]